MRPTDAPDVARLLETWYRGARRDLPWRRTRRPYRIWVAEIMLQQTTVRAVVPYYRRFLRLFPGVRSLAGAGLPRVLAAWSGLGYYRRARHLHAAARCIVARHGGRLPRTAAGLRDLPGVGRYTAGAIASIAFGERAAILDGNVARVLSRLRLLRGPAAGNAKRLWREAASLVEAAAVPGDLNQALMELGALVCSPERPACAACPLRRRCRARAAGAQENIPPPRRRRTPEKITQALALVERGGRVLLRRRAGTGLMEGFWELPPLQGELHLEPLHSVARLRHSITYRRLHVEVRSARLLAEPRGATWRWVDRRSLHLLPIGSLARKALRLPAVPPAGRGV